MGYAPAALFGQKLRRNTHVLDEGPREDRQTAEKLHERDTHAVASGSGAPIWAGSFAKRAGPRLSFAHP
jgi:hypothetical protein